jgi:quercetin dioxygenase-like cupin family protein
VIKGAERDMFKQVRANKDEGAPVSPTDFDGEVIRQVLHAPEDDGGVELLAVFFAAGARTRPHIHEVDQTLHVVEGEGVLATETSRQIIRPGDILVVPRGVWHWHGATPDSSMCHLSIKVLGGTNWSPPEKNWARYMDV